MRGSRLIHSSVIVSIGLSIGTMIACGKSGSPTAPSTTSSSAVTAGATINGTIVGSSPITTSATPTSTITVNVVGTTITVTIDSSGRFSLAGVPAGTVQLHFKGSNVDATATLTAVQSTDTITITVTLTPTTATIDTDDRGNNQGNQGNSQDQLEGTITAIPATPAGSFVVDGQTVQTNSSTDIDEGGTTEPFSALKVGTQVHVSGNTTTGGGFLATKVEIQTPETQPQQTTVTGAIKSVTGTAPNLTLVVGTTTVTTNSDTQIGNNEGGDSIRIRDGGGDSNGNFALLQVNVNVTVTGTTQTNGSVLAKQISFTTTQVTGVIMSVTGTAPNLTLVVGTTTVHTNANTQVGSGDNTSSLQIGDNNSSSSGFSQLTVGANVKVNGITESDGSVIAQQISLVTTNVQGTIATFSGTCPVVTFTVGTTTVVTTATTSFGDAGCSSLKVGSKVDVTGFKQANGSILATKVSSGDEQ